MAAPFRGFLTSHNGSSVNFLGDGTIFWGDGTASISMLERFMRNVNLGRPFVSVRPIAAVPTYYRMWLCLRPSAVGSGWRWCFRFVRPLGFPIQPLQHVPHLLA